MPRGDRTGPDSSGPMTGRAAGYCAGFEGPGYRNQMPGGRGLSLGHGRGFFNRGYGRGGGIGFRFGRCQPDYSYYAPEYYPEQISREEELASLEKQVKNMEEDVKAAKDRIVELEKEE